MGIGLPSSEAHVATPRQVKAALSGIGEMVEMVEMGDMGG